MPTDIRPRHRPATRGQADDHRIARGQIALIDALLARLSQIRDRIVGFFITAVR